MAHRIVAALVIASLPLWISTAAAQDDARFSVGAMGSTNGLTTTDLLATAAVCALDGSVTFEAVWHHVDTRSFSGPDTRVTVFTLRVDDASTDKTIEYSATSASTGSLHVTVSPAATASFVTVQLTVAQSDWSENGERVWTAENSATGRVLVACA